MKFAVYSVVLLLLLAQEGDFQWLFKQEMPPIVYKRQAFLYDWVYSDDKTGADDDISIWRPNTFQYDFFALGDLALPNHNFPTQSTVLVKDMTGDALRAPVGAEEIWNDQGSQGSHDGTIYRLVPPEGYVCLGAVALNGYEKDKLDLGLYRCVKDTYVTEGKYEKVWSDIGSGAYNDVTVWANRQSSAHPYGVDAGTFTGFGDHGDPTGSPYILDGEIVGDILDVNIWNPDAVITVYEMPDAYRVYDDGWTEAYAPIQVWRANTSANIFSLGDFATANSDYDMKPRLALAAKAIEKDVLDAPEDFVEIWNDHGSKGHKSGVFYAPTCHAGFRAIGYLVHNKYDEVPDKSQIRCVNEKYTMQGDSWEWVWDDSGSGAYSDVTVYRPIPTGAGQGMNAISFIRSYQAMDEPPYVLNPAFVNYVTGRPVKRYMLTDVEYQLDFSDVSGQTPESIQRETVKNEDPESPQTADHEIDYTYSQEYTWNNHMSGELGMSMEVEAGVPFFFEAKYQVSAVATYEHEWGGSTTESTTSSVNCRVTVNPCKTVVCIVSGTRYNMDVPYVATVTTEYDDGTIGVKEEVEGVFRGVEVMDIMVDYKPGDPVPGCVPVEEE